MPDKIRPEDVLTICNVLLKIHREKAEGAFARDKTQAEREEAYQGTNVIKDCIDRLCAELLDAPKHSSVRQQIYRKITNSEEAAVSMNVIKDWAEPMGGI